MAQNQLFSITVSQGSAWKNTRFAAAKASLTANRHVCASQNVDLNKALLLMDDRYGSHKMSIITIFGNKH